MKRGRGRREMKINMKEEEKGRKRGEMRGGEERGEGNNGEERRLMRGMGR